MRYKMVARTLLILSVFSFVLAAPVPVQKVREAYADAVDAGENVIIVSGKRAERGNPYKRMVPGWDKSDPEYLTWTPPPQSPSSSSTGSESPLRPLSTPGKTEMPLESVLKTENQPASSSGVKSVSWGPTTEIYLNKPEDPQDARLDTAEAAPGEQQASSSGTKSVSWGDTTKIHFPGEEVLPFPEAAKPQSTGFISKFKSVFGKLGVPSFRPRFQRTVDTGAR